MSSVKLMIPRAMAIVAVAAGLFCGVAAQAGQEQQPPPPPPPLEQQPLFFPKVIRKSGGVLQGSATRRVEPSYPPLAKAAHISGSVVVELTIDESGDVASAAALSGHPLLRDAAVQAALGWKFQPAKLQGVPVKVIGTITFNFMMDSDQGLSIEAAEKALEEHPDSAQAHYDLAMAYARKGRRSDAIQALRDAIRVGPEFEAAYRDLGLYLRHPGTESEAFDMLKEAIRLNARDTEALSTLVAIYLDSKRTEDAVSFLKQWINDDPSNADPFIALAAIDVTMEKYGEAEEALKQGLRVEPKRTEAYVALGDLYTRVGRTADAIDILKHAIGPLGPEAGFAIVNIAKAHLALGMAYVKAGDKSSAMDEYNALKPMFSTMADDLLKEINK